MGKKSEKVNKERPIVQSTEEIVNKTPEPYKCIGNFATDFTELWRERNPGYQLPLVVRDKREFSPTAPNDSGSNLQTGKKGSKDDKRPPVVQHQSDPDQMSQEDREIFNAIGFKPRTFLIKPTYSALKPLIFVETDNVDKPDNITEISIRRWKVDPSIIDLLGMCLTSVTKLTTITFWRVGLTSEAISQLAETLSKCETIKFLTIENNQEATLENYHELITAKSLLTKLNLRYCNITPIGAQLLADELGTLTNVGNSKLLVLDLTGCPLGDFGAISIAKAMKINRTLLSLSLSNCDIGDLGCTELAKMISRYILTDEEIFARRQMMSERNISESAKSVSSFSRNSISSQNNSPPLSRRGDLKDRPVSVRSSSKEDKNKKDKTNAAKNKKDIKEEKHEKQPPKNKKEEKNTPVKKVALDVTKVISKSKAGRSARLSKSNNQLDNMSEAASENMDNIHPLLHKVNAVEPGKLVISGNFMLLILNLSRNRITDEGLKVLNEAISYQSSISTSSKSNRTGLLKLFLQGNEFDVSNDKYRELQTTMQRDHKSRSTNLEVE